MPFVSKAGLKALTEYKYVSGGYSKLDLLMNGYWVWCVNQLPLWLAPNLVTAIGTIACLVHHVVVLVYSQALSNPLPWWVNVMGAVSLFFYNTMDSIDGKQARRTNSSSPLGQLFDHGCDGLQTLIVTLSLAAAFQLGTSWLCTGFLLTIQLTFFLGQWEEYHTHCIRTHVGLIGVTEGQYLSVVLFLVSAVTGPEFWTTPVFYGFAPNEIAVGSLAFSQVFVISSFLINTISKAESRVKAVAHLVPIFAAMGMLLALIYDSRLPGHENALVFTHPRLVFFSFGLLNVHLMTVMIVMNLCKMPYPVFPTVIVAAAGVMINTFTHTVPATVATFAFLGYVAVTYLNFAIDSVTTITRHLGIYCFVLGKRPSA